MSCFFYCLIDVCWNVILSILFFLLKVIFAMFTCVCPNQSERYNSNIVEDETHVVAFSI